MTAHPLPELPCEEHKDEGISSWQFRKAQVTGKNRCGSVQDGNGISPEFSDDASNIRTKTSGSPGLAITNPIAKKFCRASCRDSAVPTPPPSPYNNNSPPAFDIFPDNHPEPCVDEAAIPEVRNTQYNPFWHSNGNTIEDAEVLFSQVSLDAVNTIASQSRPVHNNQEYMFNDVTFYDSSTDSDSDHHRIPLVRFAPTHSFLRTPSPPPPPPPPHQIATHSMSLSMPNLLISRPSYTSLSPSSSTVYTPYGPRTPPWGSQETLARERRNRIDTRGRDMLLQERFEVDRQRREWKWRRVEEETRMGRRRSEGERVRAVVRKLYPDEDVEDRRERGCMLCVVM